MKKLTALAIATTLSLHTFAGGIISNTNQNAAFLRNPARDASTEIDAVYSNPAGLAFLQEGWHFSLNNQSAFQSRTIKSTLPVFALNGGSPTKEYKGKAEAWLIPSLQAAFKTGNWTFSGSFAVVGGGGTVVFGNGLGSFEASTAKGLFTATGGALTGYSADLYLEGSQIIYGAQLGVTYEIIPGLAAFAGARGNIVNNGYSGYIRNIRGSVGLLTIPVPNVEVETTQSGFGVTPILGVDYKVGNFNFGAKYEFKSCITVKNKTVVDGSGLFTDGTETPNDIPALLTVGARYDILPSLHLSAGYHHFFDKEAKMAGDKQNELSHGTDEYLLGLEYDINNRILVSCGAQRTQFGIKDGFQSDMAFSLSSFSYGIGGAYNFMPNLRLNVGVLYTAYDTYEKSYGTAPGSMKEEYTRTNVAFALGLNYNF